jgi:hypothetical protein
MLLTGVKRRNTFIGNKTHVCFINTLAFILNMIAKNKYLVIILAQILFGTNLIFAQKHDTLVKLKIIGHPRGIDFSEEVLSLQAKYGFYCSYNCVKIIPNFGMNNLLANYKLNKRNGKDWELKYEAEYEKILTNANKAINE